VGDTSSGNIVQQGRSSQTALRVAQARAVHQLLDDPIVFEDPLALRILGAEQEAALRDDPFVLNDPIQRAMRAGVIVRARFAEDELARAVSAGVRQFVVLGAGLDTFAYRNTDAALRVFEVDHPSTQVWKRRLLVEAGIAVPPELAYVPVDFERDTLADSLAAAGFRTDRPACFSWLGVTMYLTEAAILETLRFIAGLAKGSSVTFDFAVTEEVMNPVERVASQVVRQMIAAMGEPWLSAFNPVDLRGKVLALNFAEARFVDWPELNRLYLNRRKDGLHNNARLLCARV
jgi:methyltransferase (TIGR00027 family)